MKWRRLKLKAKLDSNLSDLSFKAIISRRFQRQFHQVNLHHPTTGVLHA